MPPAMTGRALARRPKHPRSRRSHLRHPFSIDDGPEPRPFVFPARGSVTKRPSYRAMVLLATWCALRLGELCELRRGDVDLGQEVLHIRRAVVRTRNDGFQ